MDPERGEGGQEVAGLRLNLGNRQCSGSRDWFHVAPVAQDSHPVEMAMEKAQEVGSTDFVQEGQEAVDIGFVQEDQEVADIDWAVGQREKDTDPAAIRRGVGGLDSAGESLGPRTDYWSLVKGIGSGKLLGLGTCGKQMISYPSCTWRKSVAATYPLEGGPCGGAYDGAYPERRGGGVSEFVGMPNPPL